MQWRGTDEYLKSTVQEEIQEHFSARRGILVAEQNGQLVGTIQFVPEHKDRELADGKTLAHLQSLEIKDNFRNLGLGTLMVCKVERLSLERGFERLTLTVHPDNGPAVSLCHKLGYQPFKYFHEIMGGKEIPVVCMLKKLL